MGRLRADLTTRLRSFELSVRLDVGAETLALVGPSGAGKTTVLSAIAGLATPGDGRIALGEQVWFDARAGVRLPPERRSVGMVFQDYALFPHLSVRENVAFGGTARVDALLERMRIADLAGERPGSLSGGERQRVALARALAREPGVLLLDEPLAALDAHTRATVRAELQDVLAELRLPVIVVTHDFRDAAALADRAAVIVDGRVRQEGTVGALVEAPADAFVAAFTGASLLAGTATADGGGAVVRLDGGGEVRLAAPADGPVGIAVHPWEVELLRGDPGPAGPGRVVLERVVTAVAPDEGRTRVRLGDLVADAPATAVPAPGERVWAVFAVEHARLVADAGAARRPT